MHGTILAALLFQSFFALLVQATLYVIEPTAGFTCSGGKPCTVEWLDDGTAPLLSQIGPCQVALYNGDHVLVQQIEPVDVSVVHSLTFTPDPKAGPDSDEYYINFTSVNILSDLAARYSQFSPGFTLNLMTGILASPVASDTSTLPVPSSVLSASPNPVSVTSTVSVVVGTPGPHSSSSGSSSVASTSTPASQSASSASSSSGAPATQSSSGSPSSSTQSVSNPAPSPSSSASSSVLSRSTSNTSGSPSVVAASSDTSTSSSPPTQSAPDSVPATTLTVSPTVSGFSTARATSTAPPSSDSVPPGSLSSSVPSGSSSSGAAHSTPGTSLFATASSFALVLFVAMLL